MTGGEGNTFLITSQVTSLSTLRLWNGLFIILFFSQKKSYVCEMLNHNQRLSDHKTMPGPGLNGFYMHFILMLLM